jgi:hypothetical protein
MRTKTVRISTYLGIDGQQEKEVEMMYLFGPEDAAAVRRLRTQRSERHRVMAKSQVIDSFVRPESEPADIIEVAFGRACQSDRIGA